MINFQSLFLSIFAFLFIACSGSSDNPSPIAGAFPPGAGGNPPVDGAGATPPDFSGIINAETCMNPFWNPRGEADFWEEELSSAIRSGDAACIKKIFEVSGLSPNQPVSGFFESEPTLPIWRALEDKVFFFSEPNEFSVLKVLVEAGVDLNVTNSNGDTPLHVALKQIDSERYPSGAQYLIQSGKMNLNTTDSAGKAAIHYIAQQKNIVTMNIMVQQKPDLNLQDRSANYPLFTAINAQWLDGSMAPWPWSPLALT